MSEIIYNENNQCRLVNDNFPPSEWFDYIDEEVSSGYRRYKCQRTISAETDPRSKKEIKPERKTTKWGYINDSNLNTSFEGEYMEIKPCQDGYFAVKTIRGWSICVLSDKRYYERYYDIDYYEDIVYWSNGFMSLQYPVRSVFGLKWRLLKYAVPARPIETQWGDIVAEYEFKDTIFTENLIFCRYKENVWRMFDKTGKRLMNGTSFSEVNKCTGSSFVIVKKNIDDKYGILNKEGKFFKEPKYKNISFDKENLQFILKDEKNDITLQSIETLIDTNGISHSEFIMKDEKNDTILQSIETLIDTNDISNSELIKLMNDELPIQNFFATNSQLNKLYEFLKGKYKEEDVLQVIAMLEGRNLKEVIKNRDNYKDLQIQLDKLSNQTPESEEKIHPLKILESVDQMKLIIIRSRKQQEGKTDDEIYSAIKNLFPNDCMEAERQVEDEYRKQIEDKLKTHKNKIQEIKLKMENLCPIYNKNEKKTIEIQEKKDNNLLEGLTIKPNDIISKEMALKIIDGRNRSRNIINGKKYMGIFFKKDKKVYGIEQGWNEHLNCYYFAGVGNEINGNQHIGTINENRSITKNNKKMLLFEAMVDGKYQFVDLLAYDNYTYERDNNRTVIKFKFKSLIAHNKVAD